MAAAVTYVPRRPFWFGDELKMSNNKEDQSYDELVRLANDPTTSNEARDAYRARLNALFGDRLREGFSFASQQVKPAN
jgi:hypothetical protein